MTDNRTKEEILKENFGPGFEEFFGVWAKDMWLHAAMDDWAKQRAIGFKKFTSLYFNGEIIDEPDQDISDEKLYELYPKSQ